MKRIISPLLFLLSLIASPQTPPISELLASDGITGDRFGISVAISGEYAIVGASGNDHTQGSAYIFKKIGNQWEEKAKITASDGEVLDLFGYSVDIWSDYIIVGSPQRQEAKGLGAVYVFVKNGESWIQQAKLIDEDPNPVTGGGWFGYSVAIYGNTAVIGDAWGKAVIFSRNPDLTWHFKRNLIPSDIYEYHDVHAGLNARTVDIWSDQIVVGFPYRSFFDENNNSAGFDLGHAYVFEKYDDDWIETAILTAGDGTSSDNFGYSASIVENQVIIGATGLNARAIYFFEKNNNIWTEKTKHVDDSRVFGYDVNLSGNYAIVGALGPANTNTTDVVYVFKKNQGIWNLFFKMEDDNPQELGFSVATNGIDFWTGDFGSDNYKGKVLKASLPSCSQTNLSVTIPNAYAIPGGNLNTVYIGYQPATSITLAAQASSGNAPYSYSWSTNPIQTTQQITVSLFVAGTYNYTVTATDVSDCSAQATKTITAVDIRTPGKPGKVNICHRDLKGKWTTLSVLAGSVPEHLAHGDYLGTCLPPPPGVEVGGAAMQTDANEITLKEFKIYPNPATHFLDVQWTTKNTSQSTINILNVEGRVVRTFTMSGTVNTKRISLDGLAKGIYMLVLKTGSDQRVSKFVIQ
jgi:hypothetical protein